MIGLLIVIASAGMVAWIVLRARLLDLEQRVATLGDSAVTQSQIQQLTERLFRAERSLAELKLPVSGGIEQAERIVEVPQPVAQPKRPAVAEENGLEEDGARKVAPGEPVTRLPAEPATLRPSQSEPLAPSADSRLRAFFRNDELEAVVGGSLLNKVGAIVLVIGIALFLAYSFGRMTAAGRASLALTVSAAILGAGVWAERRERYRLFARGLIGAGWAALYATAYAIYALPATRIIDNPFAGSVGLLLVAAGMIGHSLRYRAQAVTGTAYFAAFAALAATPSTPFATISLVPLAASLLFLANAFEWHSMALFGLVATYATCIARGASNAPLASTQSLFLAYWLLFEAFDLLRVRKRLLAGGLEWIAPLNAAAFLALSYLAWSQKATGMLWLAAAYGSALYLSSAILRVRLLPPSALPANAEVAVRLRLGSYELSLTLAAVLGGLAIVGKVPGVWSSVALAMEAELLYLAGVRFSAGFLRGCGGAAFAFSLGRLFTDPASDGQSIVLGHVTWNWTPPALFHLFLFYVNRVLKQPNRLFSSMAACLAAVVLAAEMPEGYVGASLLLFALALLDLGVRKRLPEFRIQAYVIAVAGVTASAYVHMAHHHNVSSRGLAISLALAYACALRSRGHGGALDDADAERGILASGASAATAALAAILIWSVVPAAHMAMAWLLLALVLFEAGNRALPRELRNMAWPISALGLGGAIATHGAHFVKFAPAEVWMCYLAMSLVAWIMTMRVVVWPPANLGAREKAKFTDVMSAGGAFAAMAFLWLTLPDPVVSTVWAALGVAAVEMGGLASVETFGLVGMTVLTLTLTRALTLDVVNAALWNGISERVLSTLPSIAAFYLVAHRLKRGPAGGRKLTAIFSLFGTGLLAALLFESVSGGLFTVSLGLEGLALLGAGFPLRERILRLQGLALLLACILKLFVYDLRNLETMYRILSFVALGLIMLGVSWIYTRFREQLQRLL
jgi:Predicted membrane protein (DUF2339)